jgi:hypothetical protein
MSGFEKLITSSKYQIALLAIGLIYAAQPLFGLEPATATKSIEIIAVAYFGARILEPVVEMLATRLKNGNTQER